MLRSELSPRPPPVPPPVPTSRAVTYRAQISQGESVGGEKLELAVDWNLFSKAALCFTACGLVDRTDVSGIILPTGRLHLIFCKEGAFVLPRS